MKITLEKIKKFIIQYHVILLVIIVPLSVIIVLTGMIIYNESSNFCYTCHINQGNYKYFDKNRPVHQNIDKNKFSCIKCHKDKAVQTIYARDLKNYKKQAQLIGNLQRKSIINPRDVYTTEQCLACHPDKVDVREIEPYLLSDERLKKIGLRFDKRLHYRFETFRDEDRQLYKELLGKTTLTTEENEELKLLEKIKSGNCGQCHIQNKLIEGKKLVDKQVNFIARNPISCAGCHEQASRLTHPGKTMAPPTKEVCQKCHHGKIHGKFRIFKADCVTRKDTEHCIKCHPFYKPEMYMAKRE